MATCEDYPCCGHTDGLPCDWKSSDYMDPAVAAANHIGCDHNTGYCEYEDEEEEDMEEHEDAYFDVEDYDEERHYGEW